ncbi:phosphohistidine phosphatase, SixA [Onishia taeanensis]|uniref:Phosphohistidine phosphatase, SixA n=1 Tax=Onishia taeanensis TaxID=284577 RepID=A0A1G7NIN1_9GAMM|nr:phosphohistidine phosphatase SixA [Halomonas taeanensis]SDF73924.1 phosphohistidine phosphatase, SixA [Halomonas taeanensis]
MRETLWIMRHGQAGPGRPDAERSLTDEGRREASDMAEWLAQRLADEGLPTPRVLASPYRRAQQTATLMAERLGVAIETLPIITPDDPIGPILDWLIETQEASPGPLLLVSHMPLVGVLTAQLTDGPRALGLGFPTAAIARLESDVFAAGCARLVGLEAPGSR